MVQDDIILYNDEGELIYDVKIYSGGYIMEKKKIEGNKTIKRSVANIPLVSCGIPGKTCLISSLNNEVFTENTIGTIGIEKIDYFYSYNEIKYKIILYDTSGAERFRSIILKLIETSNIVIYLFDLTKENDINESFIDEIIEHKRKNVQIYLIGNKIDITRINIEKYRKQAKILIDRGKIHKYFELSAKTGEGVRTLKKYLEIDSPIIIDNYEPKNKNLAFNPKIIIKINTLKKLNKYLNN